MKLLKKLVIITVVTLLKHLKKATEKHPWPLERKKKHNFTSKGENYEIPL